VKGAGLERGRPVLDTAMEGVGAQRTVSGRWSDYLRPLRFDHWVKNLVVPVGSLLAFAARHAFPDGPGIAAMGVAFVVSGLVSSVNYAVNEVLDAPFDARHPTKRERPIPSGRVRIGPLLVVTAGVGLLAVVLVWAWLSPAVLQAAGALFVAGLVYNLPPIRLKDRPYLDVLTESLTNPIRLALGWHAVVSGPGPPLLLLGAVWAFGGFLMTGKRVAELRLLGDVAARYRPTFRAYSVRGLVRIQVAYALTGLGMTAALGVTLRPSVLRGLPLVAGLLAWAFKMTFEPKSPLVDPEHLYRRPVFLLCAIAVFAVLVALTVGWR
jgi:decaprenyl-phosphate phosphoribosyltransferase